MLLLLREMFCGTDYNFYVIVTHYTNRCEMADPKMIKAVT